MPEIYKHASVAASQQFYGRLLSDYSPLTIADHMLLLAKRLMEGYEAEHPVAAVEINNYHPEWLGKSARQIFSASLAEADIQQAIASQYGFTSWGTVEKATMTYDLPFEQALHALLHGEVIKLRDLLQQRPDLVSKKSPYGHQAQLIHYVGNNGVEMWRQQVPLNLAEVIRVLLEAGADKSATMPVYGGHFTVLQLFESSAHPSEAGIREEVITLLS